MFRKSLLLTLAILSLVFVSTFASQFMMARQLPSAYDSGLTVEKAFQTSKKPLLVEFYSDTCGTCQRLTPALHAIYQRHYQNRLTLVMVNVEDPEQQPIAELFGVKELPGIYVFDFKHMKKHTLEPRYFLTEATLREGLDNALKSTVTQ